LLQFLQCSDIGETLGNVTAVPIFYKFPDDHFDNAITKPNPKELTEHSGSDI
jgi:hypothetical protein